MKFERKDMLERRKRQEGLQLLPGKQGDKGPIQSGVSERDAEYAASEYLYEQTENHRKSLDHKISSLSARRNS